MGILDRFRKKQDRKKLETLGTKGPSPVVEPKKEQPRPEKTHKETRGDKAASRKQAPVTPETAHRVLLGPLVTEKGARIGAYNQYLFAVNPQANKVQIAKAVKEL